LTGSSTNNKSENSPIQIQIREKLADRLSKYFRKFLEDEETKKDEKKAAQKLLEEVHSTRCANGYEKIPPQKEPGGFKFDVATIKEMLGAKRASVSARQTMRTHLDIVEAHECQAIVRRSYPEIQYWLSEGCYKVIRHAYLDRSKVSISKMKVEKIHYGDEYIWKYEKEKTEGDITYRTSGTVFPHLECCVFFGATQIPTSDTSKFDVQYFALPTTHKSQTILHGITTSFEENDGSTQPMSTRVTIIHVAPDIYQSMPTGLKPIQYLSEEERGYITNGFPDELPPYLTPHPY